MAVDPPEPMTVITTNYGPTTADGYPIASGPFSEEEAARIYGEFDWEDTVPLPETAPNGDPAVFYTIIGIREWEETSYLDRGGIYWDTLPLFGEGPVYSGPVVIMPGTGSGTFVFALLPASVYNIIREGALAGDVLFDLVILRRPPDSIPTYEDGSVDIRWLMEQGFRFPAAEAALERAGDDLGVRTALLSEAVVSAARGAPSCMV